MEQPYYAAQQQQRHFPPQQSAEAVDSWYTASVEAFLRSRGEPQPLGEVGEACPFPQQARAREHLQPPSLRSRRDGAAAAPPAQLVGASYYPAARPLLAFLEAKCHLFRISHNAATGLQCVGLVSAARADCEVLSK